MIPWHVSKPTLYLFPFFRGAHSTQLEQGRLHLGPKVAERLLPLGVRSRRELVASFHGLRGVGRKRAVDSEVRGALPRRWLHWAPHIAEDPAAVRAPEGDGDRDGNCIAFEALEFEAIKSRLQEAANALGLEMAVRSARVD